MQILTKINHFIKKNSLSLGAVFLIFMNIIMLITIISITAYFMQMTKDLMAKSLDERQTISKSIANIVYSSTKDSIALNDYSKLNDLSKRLINNRLINFVVVYDSNVKNKILWSTIDDIKGKTLSLKEVKEKYKKTTSFESEILYEKGVIANKVTVIIAYTLESNISYYLR